MSGDWEYYTNGDCPNCFGKKKGCRRRKRTNIVHCRYRGAGSPKYYYLRDDALGFGMYQLIEDRVAWSKEQRQLSEFEKEQRRLADLEEKRQREEAIAAKYENSLSIEERDRQIRKILDQLWLWPSHLEKLRKRFSVLGLEPKKIDELIKEADCKSVHQWQGLDIPVSDLFPGVRLGGRSLLNSGSGILIPIKNEEGLYIGLQLRLDRPTEGKKYVWLAGERKRANRPSSHLQNGDLPLSLHLPSFNQENNQVNIIGLTEGIGFKGCLAALRLNIPVIGASGGNFTRSAKLLRHYLDFLGCNKNTQIVLFADAGSIKNKSTLKIYRNTIALIESWGYKVKIGWWNQIEKSVGDIDEIEQDNLKEIEYLSLNEFIATSDREIRSTLRLKAVIASSIAEQKRLEGIAIRKSKNNNEPEKITSKNGIKLYNTHRLTYKIDHLIHDKRLPNLLPLLPKNGILNLKSAKGSGKSHQIRGTIGSAREEGRKVISITPRIGLGREQAVNWSINWIDDNGYTYWVEIEEELTVESHRQKGLFDKDKITFKKVRVTKKVEKKTKRVEEAEAIGVCWDSLHKLFNSSWKDILVIVDEAESGVKHLLTSSTLKGKRSMILAGLEEKLAETLASEDGMVLLADADLSDISVDYFKSFYPETKITTIVNTHKAPSPWNVELYISEKAKDKVYGKLIKLIAKGKRIAIPVDSQKEGRALEIKLKKIFPKKKIKVVDRLYTQTKDGKEFVENINAKLIEEQLDILIYTPSISMGVSIDEKAFDWVVGFYYGVLEPSEIRQSLARYRPAAPRLVWCNPRGLFPDSCTLTNAKEIGSYIFKYNKEALEQLARYKKQKELNRDPDDDELLAALLQMRDFENKEWRDIHLKTYCRIIARRNYSFYNLAALLEHQLKEEGHRVTIKNSEEKNGIGESIRDIKKELNDAYIHKFTTAKAISMMEASQRQKRKASLTEEQEIELEKALLQDQLPEVDLNNFDFNKKLLANRREFLLANRLFWLYQNKDAAIFYDDRRWSNALDKYIEHGIFYLPDIKALLPKIELLIELGLFELIKLDNLDKIYSKHDESAIAFFNLALKQKERVKRIFGITISEVSPVMTLIQNLLVKVGIKLTATRKRVNGDRQYLYQINRQAYQDKDRAIVLTALQLKYQTVRSEYLAKNENSNAVPSAPTYIETNGVGVGQSNVDESSQNAVPSDAIYIETDKVVMGQSNVDEQSQNAVPSVAINIETDKVGVGQLNIDSESQSAVP
ncbi:MAG: plasmid replication protein, CyRepA1 family [Prochloraceae cyanobacterium]